MKWPISAKGKSGWNLKGAPHLRQLAVLSAWQEGQRDLKGYFCWSGGARSETGFLTSLVSTLKSLKSE
jgi:hypothetical protein